MLVTFDNVIFEGVFLMRSTDGKCSVTECNYIGVVKVSKSPGNTTFGQWRSCWSWNFKIGLISKQISSFDNHTDIFILLFLLISVLIYIFCKPFILIWHRIKLNFLFRYKYHTSWWFLWSSIMLTVRPKWEHGLLFSVLLLVKVELDSWKFTDYRTTARQNLML